MIARVSSRSSLGKVQYLLAMDKKEGNRSKPSSSNESSVKDEEKRGTSTPKQSQEDPSLSFGNLSTVSSSEDTQSTMHKKLMLLHKRVKGEDNHNINSLMEIAVCLEAMAKESTKSDEFLDEEIRKEEEKLRFNKQKLLRVKICAKWQVLQGDWDIFVKRTADYVERWREDALLDPDVKKSIESLINCLNQKTMMDMSPETLANIKDCTNKIIKAQNEGALESKEEVDNNYKQFLSDIFDFSKRIQKLLKKTLNVSKKVEGWRKVSKALRSTEYIFIY